MTTRLTMGTARRCTRTALAVLATACLAACGSSVASRMSQGTLSVARVERAITTSALAEHGVHAAVTCPGDVPEKAAYAFTCTAKLSVGSYPVTVTETNGHGHVRYDGTEPLAALDISKVEHAIVASVAQQRRLRASVSCPGEVLQQAGLVFDCTATIAGRRGLYRFAVTETDDQGHVAYVGV